MSFLAPSPIQFAVETCCHCKAAVTHLSSILDSDTCFFREEETLPTVLGQLHAGTNVSAGTSNSENWF